MPFILLLFYSRVSKLNSRFPDRGKLAAVTPLDKGESVRTLERNFRPVIVFNTFPNIYEKIIKYQISPHLDKTLSVFVAAYRKAYSTQHILIKML